MARDRWAGRGDAAGKRALAGAGCVVMASLLVAAVGSASSDRRGRTPARATIVHSVAVGPKGLPGGGPAAQTPVLPGGASQLITGVAASTSAVRFSAGGRPDYYGTEPGMMTFARRGGELIVTVVPR